MLVAQEVQSGARRLGDAKAVAECSTCHGERFTGSPTRVRSRQAISSALQDAGIFQKLKRLSRVAANHRRGLAHEHPRKP